MQDAPQPNRILLDEKTMAAQLSVSWRHLMELRKKRIVPCVRLGRLVRYNPAKVAHSLERLTVSAIGAR